MTSNLTRFCARCGKPFTVRKPSVKTLHCGHSCAVMATTRRVKPIAVRFAAKVNKIPGVKSCWPWTGAIDDKGYGRISRGRAKEDRSVPAQRIAYELASGEPIPDGFWALHTCDNPPCCRNDEAGFYMVGDVMRPRFGHIYLGTQVDNDTDMRAKGRHPMNGRAGTRSARAQLSEDAIRDIRARCAAGQSQQSVADLYEINQTTISRIHLRQIHKHVD